MMRSLEIKEIKDKKNVQTSFFEFGFMTFLSFSCDEFTYKNMMFIVEKFNIFMHIYHKTKATRLINCLLRHIHILTSVAVLIVLLKQIFV